MEYGRFLPYGKITGGWRGVKLEKGEEPPFEVEKPKIVKIRVFGIRRILSEGVTKQRGQRRWVGRIA